MLDAEAVLHETRRLLEEPERQSHVSWIWGRALGQSVVVIYRWLREPGLRAYHRDVVDYSRLFDPVDEVILAEIVANEIEESGKVDIDVPQEIIDVVPQELRSKLHWAI